jgi:hypothetical protein
MVPYIENKNLIWIIFKIIKKFIPWKLFRCPTKKDEETLHKKKTKT